MKLICAVAALAAVAALPVYADCTAPQAPQNLPDGNTATLQQMVAGQKAVQAYNAATNAYLDCLSNDHKAALVAAGPKATDDEKAKLDQAETTKHNAAVDQLKSIVDGFNEQIRIFKAKGSKG
jgi:predicted dinucleotide-binding enzyme